MDSPVNWLRKKHHYGRYAIVKGLVKGKGKNLLDIGCGSPANCMKEGSFLTFLGYGQGMDIEPRKIKFKFTIGDMMKMPFPAKKFEVVTAVEVIEHVSDPVKALHEVHRVLKPGGTFVMSTPNNIAFFKFFWFFWEKTFGREWHCTHLTEYKKEEWLKIIRKTGLFRIKKVIDYWHINTIYHLEKI